MGIRYCFEENHVKETLNRSRRKDLAVIDTDGISAGTVRAAVDRDVFVYDYLNWGALERERSFYADMKDLRLASYDGWPGEYWVDVTSDKWKQHIIDLAREKKSKGVHGLYFDNGDIYWMAKDGFDEAKCDMLRKAPSAAAVYKASLDVITTIVRDVGLIVMPNGADLLVRKMFADGYGKPLIRTINQEGCIYEDFKKQSSSERKYRTAYMDWAKKNGLYVRGIEYVKSKTGIATCRATYLAHGWQGLYISKHKDLRGD